MRGKPELFADHYSQARLFWRSQTPTERNHIIAAYRFELTRVQTQAVRERVISMLANVAAELAEGVASGLGIAVPPAQPLALEREFKSEVETSAALSLFARPGDGRVTARRVALLVADGAHGATLRAVDAALAQAQAVSRFVGPRLGEMQCADGPPIDVEVSLEAAPSPLWDAVVLPDGDAAKALSGLAHALDFVKEQYRHCKPMLVLGKGSALLSAAGVKVELPGGQIDPGLVIAGASGANAKGPANIVDRAVADFITALAKHRHFEREWDPPAV